MYRVDGQMIIRVERGGRIQLQSFLNIANIDGNGRVQFQIFVSNLTGFLSVSRLYDGEGEVMDRLMMMFRYAIISRRHAHGRHMQQDSLGSLSSA